MREVMPLFETKMKEEEERQLEENADFCDDDQD